jgi:hypothetical protein
MSRRWLLSLVSLSVVVVLTQLSAANTALRVNEQATRFLIQDQTLVVLEVMNPSNHLVPVHLKLELIAPDDTIRARASRDETLKPGTNKLSIPLVSTGPAFTEKDDKTLPWYRLCYHLNPLSESQPVPDGANGTISLSEIDTPDVFTLEVSAARETHRGARYFAHIRALHPLTLKPVKDVNVSVGCTFDGEKVSLTGSGVTDADGYALVAVNIPLRLHGDEGELEVVARHGGYRQTAANEIQISENAQIMVTTDKTIYQPGHPLHVRALVFNSENHAAANVEASLKITDPEGTAAFKTTLRTSRFGVASADWIIPENTRLGDYAIEVQTRDEAYGRSQGSQYIRISRYDLPNFAVTVKPDRAYYLPSQDATVEVRADYLFGQPVKRGHVRVVRESERHWNFREQRWETSDGDHYEGETDEAGRFVAHIDLRQDHDDLAKEDYSRFSDLVYAAYFTDPTTNRIEQRRFDLRVTRDAIHIYVAQGRYHQVPGFPFAFYVATSYADGSPAPAEVQISAPADDDSPATTTPTLRTIRTNQYGVAKVTGLKVDQSDDTGPSPSLSFTARDANGAVGHHTESFYYRDAPAIRIETDRALYRSGEPIKVNIAASKPDMNVIVDVMRDSDIIVSRLAQLHDGMATLTLPYQPEFRDEVTISAYAKLPDDSNRYAFSFGSRTVLYPRNRDLQLNVHLDHQAYKPGENALADFRILTADGRPVNSALGVVIFDRAVEERARTDQEFGNRFGFYGSFSHWRRYDDQVGGVTRRDLQRIDFTKALPDGMDLVAELILGADSFWPAFFNGSKFETDPNSVFAGLTGPQIKPVEELLNSQYKNNGDYPTNVQTFRRLLFESGIDLEQMRDPWGTRYRTKFSVEKDDQVLELVSAGPDKQFDTRDDFLVERTTRPYFRFTGEAISRAVQRFHTRTGGFIRDAATLKSELKSEGIDFDALHDPWGQPFVLNFDVRSTRFIVTVRSSGPNQRFEAPSPKSDDFTLWNTEIDYLQETRARIEKALGQYFDATTNFPQSDSELREALLQSGIERDSLRDPWGHSYYNVFKSQARYTDRVTIQNYSTYGQKPKERTELTPVTQQISLIYLRSSGPDGKEGTQDDFDAANYSRIATERSNRDQLPAQPARQVFFAGSKGAIKGLVTDPAGSAVPGAKIEATMKSTSLVFKAETNDEGSFILQNLPAGIYELRCDAQGFKAAIVSDVPVSSSNITTINFIVEVGAVNETVNVSAGSESVMQTSSATVASTIVEGRSRVFINQPVETSTPRLRQYFPETLVWQPTLETDKHGRAQLQFKLADNITTWKLSVIGSTEDGEIGTAETEFKAFQPFFVEHDPPRVLTQGDQISLPVVLRNYLDKAQQVDLEMKPESWFTLTGPARQRANVPAGDSSRETFALTAVASITNGKQRVTATGAEAGDAIEKPVTVHPDGEEVSATASDIIAGNAALEVNVPAVAIPNSTRAELKVYPNLMAHLIESVEAIMSRPYGCGEQTISSTYPSLLFLRNYRKTGQDSALSARAQRYLQEGYSRLLNYRNEDGGFTYWGRGDADPALTAYALRFLTEARDLISVDEKVVDGARAWLAKQQAPDGGFPAHEYWSTKPDPRRTALLTAYVAHVLAMTQSKASDGGNAAEQKTSDSPNGLKRALDYLAPRTDEIDEPYLLAAYALAAFDAGDAVRAAPVIARLRTLAHQESGSTYWSLETNTPFYGWGLAGRVETTALVIQALVRSARIANPIENRSLTPPNSSRNNTGDVNTLTPSPTASQTNDPLIRSGLLFLLKQ